VSCVLIAGISTFGASSKLWVGVANPQFPCRRNVADWLKQSKI